MLIPYRSVRTPCRKETEIKKSIFIAQLFPVETEEEAQSILETVRKNHKDAAHHCWAWDGRTSHAPCPADEIAH